MDASSSLAEAFCWITVSSWTMALPIWSEPEDCSREAEAISWTRSAVFLMSGTIRWMISPALVAPATVEAESFVISPAAVCERSASLRTSEATTAKPLPASPARAASMAALRARRLVCRAISSMMPILPAISFMAATASSTAFPPSAASPAAFWEMLSVARELSVFCLIVAAISSTEAETSSALAACSVAPWLICCEVELICSLPAATCPTAAWTAATISRRRIPISTSDLLMPVIVPEPPVPIARSPAATRSAIAAMSFGSPPTALVTLRVMSVARAAPMSTPRMMKPIMRRLIVAARASEVLSAALACSSSIAVSLPSPCERAEKAGKTSEFMKAAVSAVLPARILSMRAAAAFL